MKIKEKLTNLTKKAKESKIFLLFSILYSFIWGTCKIIFGFITSAYFFAVSGATTLIFGFIKNIYSKNFKIESLKNKQKKSINISILLLISSFLFTFYMSRLFFIPENSNYGLILSITIATFSFTELSISIYNFFKAKKTTDILLQSFRCYNLVSSSFAIVLTQVALLSATNTPSPFFNALTGVCFGFFSILIAIYILLKSLKTKNV